MMLNLKAIMSALMIGGTIFFGLPITSKAQLDLGDWHGAPHPVPAAHCNPNCKILGGGVAEGDDFDFIDSFPENVLLDAAKARLVCSDVAGSNGCVFTGPLSSTSVDNVTHKVYTHVRSHAGAVSIQPAVPIYSIK